MDQLHATIGLLTFSLLCFPLQAKNIIVQEYTLILIYNGEEGVEPN